MAEVASPSTGDPSRSLVRVVIVMAGIVAGQCYLMGPALLGQKILLSLDLLKLPGFYLRDIAGSAPRTFSDWSQTDQILQYEPGRRFAAAEIRAGRWPAWSPYNFCGSPSGGVQWSRVQSLYLIWPTPRVLPYIQILVALIAGTGAY